MKSRPAARKNRIPVVASASRLVVNPVPSVANPAAFLHFRRHLLFLLRLCAARLRLPHMLQAPTTLARPALLFFRHLT